MENIDVRIPCNFITAIKIGKIGYIATINEIAEIFQSEILNIFRSENILDHNFSILTIKSIMDKENCIRHGNIAYIYDKSTDNFGVYIIVDNSMNIIRDILKTCVNLKII